MAEVVVGTTFSLQDFSSQEYMYIYVYTTKQQNIEEVGKVQERRQQLITVTYIYPALIYTSEENNYTCVYIY